MTNGPSLELRQEPEQEPVRELCLENFATWLEWNPPTPATIAGMLELLGNALYRQERFAEGSEVKHLAQQLRERRS